MCTSIPSSITARVSEVTSQFPEEKKTTNCIMRAPSNSCYNVLKTPALQLSTVLLMQRPLGLIHGTSSSPTKRCSCECLLFALHFCIPSHSHHHTLLLSTSCCVTPALLSHAIAFTLLRTLLPTFTLLRCVDVYANIAVLRVSVTNNFRCKRSRLCCISSIVQGSDELNTILRLMLMAA